MHVERAPGLDLLEQLRVGLVLEHHAGCLVDDAYGVGHRVLAARAVLVLDERDAQQDLLLDGRAETHDEPLVLMRQRRAVDLVYTHLVELLVCAGHVEVARERDVAPGGEAALEHVAHLHLDGLLGRYRDALGVHVCEELDDEVDAGLAALLAPNVGKVLAGEVVEEVVEVREVDLLDGLARYLVAVG